VFPEDVDISPQAKGLIQRMLEKDKKHRIKMYEILENQWLFPNS
jgi:hypothetical protein